MKVNRFQHRGHGDTEATEKKLVDSCSPGLTKFSVISVSPCRECLP